jgi:hypothetical protein
MSTDWHRSELTYCTNVHPGENLDQVSGIVSGPLSAVRQNRKLTHMAAGLWLSNPTALELEAEDTLVHFASQLEQHNITLFTLNGFPAQGFHAKRVKEAVYHPDWSEPERLDYTLKLARILARLLPQDISEGTISSVPLGFGPEWDHARHTLALDALCRCAAEFERIQQETGRQIRLCLEMEPGCALESTDALIPFFTSELPAHLASKGLDPSLIANHLGICFDVCHQAVMFENTYQAMQRIHSAGISIGKIQISSALELKSPDNDEARNSLSGFVEEKYLHQSRCRDEKDRLLEVMDLDQAFNAFPTTRPWRVHFHVPIQAETLINDGLGTTQQEIGRTLDYLRDNPELHPHLEVETYTWTALPESIRPTDEGMMVDGLSAELIWLESQMQQRGLLSEDPE